MLLNSISASNAFPNEQILIELNDLTPSLSNSRVGIHFVDSYYNYSDNKLKWDNFPLITSEGSAIPFPTAYLDIPGDFPLTYTVSGFSDHLDLVFLGGASAISVYPSRPHPTIKKIANNQIAISASFIPLTAFNEIVDTDTFRRYSSTSSLSSLPTGTISLVGAYKTAIKESFIATTVRTSTTSNSRTIQFPLTPRRRRHTAGTGFQNLSERIIRESMLAQMVFSSPELDVRQNIENDIDFIPDGVPYYLYWDDTQTIHPNAQSNRLFSPQISYVNGDGSITLLDNQIKPGFTDRSAWATKTPPIGDAFIRVFQKNPSPATFSEEMFISFHPRLYRRNEFIFFDETDDGDPVQSFYPLSSTSLYCPRGSDITVWYETSAYTTNSEISNTVNGDVFTFTSVHPPYLNGYMFNITIPDEGSQRAFTVNYHPEYNIIGDEVSAIGFETLMVDNYYQSQFSIDPNHNGLITRFIDDYSDISLSAIDRNNNIAYRSSQWFPTSSTVWFENSGMARNYSLTFETSSIYDSRYKTTDIPMILNRNKASVFVTQRNIQRDFVDVVGSISQSNSDNLTFEWDVFPPENIIIRTIDGGIVPLNTPIGDDKLEVRIENLGVDNTRITLKCLEFDISASTTWIPPNNIWTSSRLTLLGDIPDTKLINVGSLSAMFIRNGMFYRVPTTANIKWEDVSITSRNSVTFFSSSGQQIIELAPYPAVNSNTLINATFTTQNAPITINNVNFRINCYVYNNQYNYQAGSTFSLKRYPETTNLFTLISSTENSTILSSEQYTSIVYLNPTTVSLTANTVNFNIDDENIFWDINGTPLTGSTVSFNVDSINDEVCVGLSAFSAMPFGSSNRFNFSDNICFYFLPDIIPFQYTAFPQYNYLPNNELSFDNYESNFIALSSYSACHTENVFLSAPDNFDEYEWSIGKNSVNTVSPTAIIPISISDVIGGNNINVKAYNKYFPKDNPITVYNSSSADNFNFKSFPPIDISLNVSNTWVNMRDVSSRDLITTISADVLDLSAGFFNITLSSENYIFSTPIEVYSNETSLNWRFTYGDENIFQIPENSSNIFNLFLEGTAWGFIDGFDFCAEPTLITSNIISLTAFDGPDLSIWTPINTININDIVYITNTTHDSFINPFISFDFDNGYEIQSGSHSTIFSAMYDSLGTFSISMTGYRTNGEIIINKWDDFFIINESDIYDNNINRQISSEITLPFQYDDLKIKPNSWQFDTTLNTTFDKLNRNINFLNESLFIINDNLPNYTISNFGKYRGNEYWRYNLDSNVLEKRNNQYKDIVFSDEFILLLNNNNIEIRAYDSKWSLLSIIDRVTPLEFFKNISRISYQNSQLLILDSGKNNIYVGKLNTDYTFNLTHYWGGVGSKNSRTKLNNPIDMFVNQNHIYIIDTDSSNIKVYNKHLNWMNSIEFEIGIKPIAISGKNNIIYVLDDKGDINTFENMVHQSSFQATIGTRIAFDDSTNFIYICSKNKIAVYSKNGAFVNDIIMTDNINNVIVYKNETYNLLNDHIIKHSNFLKYNNITTLNTFSNNDTSYKVHRDEPISSFIINDSLDKLKDKLETLANSITGQFVKIKNIQDEFLYSKIIPSTLELNCPKSKLGVNEVVSFDTINREIYNTQQCINAAKNFINGLTMYPTNSSHFWTWEYHKIIINQRPNINKTPLSWEELTIENPTYSAITWNSIGDSTGFENSFPVGWTWQDLEKGCVNALKWEEMEDGRIRAYTWDELENIKNFSDPFLSFDNCSLHIK
jgi:hypothetical protein